MGGVRVVWFDKSHELLLIVANVGMALAVFPILKRHSESLALGYVAARVVESGFIAVGIISLLSVVSGLVGGPLVCAAGIAVMLGAWQALLACRSYFRSPA